MTPMMMPAMRLKLSIIRSAIALSIIGVAAVNQVWCQALTEFSRGNEFRQAIKTNLKALPFPTWLNPESNYVELISNATPEQVFKKFINLQDGINIGKQKRIRNIEYIGFSAEFFKTTRKNPIELIIYMPHPAVFELAENETLPSLLSYLPRPSSIADSSSIDIEGHPTKVLQLTDGSFVLVLKLPMQVRIFVRSKQQVYLTDATELLEHGNLQWLVEQLSS